MLFASEPTVGLGLACSAAIVYIASGARAPLLMMTTKKTTRRANVPADTHTPLNITIQPLDKPIVEQAVRYRRESLQADLIYVHVHISIAIDSRCTIHAVIATEYAQNRCTYADKRMDMWIGAAAVLFRVP